MIRTIDTRLYKLKNLRILDLTRNDLSKIDPRLTKLRLEVLILADNKFTEASFPDDFEDSPLSQSLEKIDISTNIFKKIPKSISRCSKLKILQADNNELISVPSQLPKSLSVLSLKRNKINFTSLPRSHYFEKLDLTGQFEFRCHIFRSVNHVTNKLFQTFIRKSIYDEARTCHSAAQHSLFTKVTRTS